MSDSFRQIENRSWLSRIRGSIAGVVVGGALVLAGVILLFWNEGRAVQRYKTLKEGSATVQPVAAERVDPANESRLVHLSGTAFSEELLEDSRIGVQAIALKLRRQVEMYQWVESRKSEERTKLGGGTETVTTYDYKQEWSSRAVDSTSFQRPQGHENPSFPLRSEEWVGSSISVGAFELGDEFVGQIDRHAPVPVNASIAEQASNVLGRPVQVADGALYAGSSPQSPQLGDLRIRYTMVEPALVSLVGSQRGNQLQSHTASTGGRISLLRYGQATPDEMFESAQTQNRTLTWILRLVGLGVLFFAFNQILRPARVLADVVPLAGRLVGTGIGFVSLMLALLLGLVVIAVGWFFYRPLLSIFLLALALGCIVLLVRRGKKAKAVELPPLPVTQ